MYIQKKRKLKLLKWQKTITGTSNYTDYTLDHPRLRKYQMQTVKSFFIPVELAVIVEETG